MKRFPLIQLAILLCMAAPCAFGWNVPRERLTYDVMYKWGLINKKAGSVSLVPRPHSTKNDFQAVLTAATAPWADNIFMLRDTLMGTINSSNFLPIYYEKIAHEGNELKHDIVRFSKKGYTSTGDCVRKVWKKGKVFRDETRELEAVGTTVDMMSSFYYMRNLPFEKWTKGHTLTINIFSGKQKEKLSFKYQGIDNVEAKGKTYPCYHITFIFTGDGGKKTSDNMDAWIRADESRVPIRLEGKLPVGKVQCELVSE